MDKGDRKLISIAVPVYNEEENIQSCYEALAQVAKDNSDYDFEFVFTDNCSTDRSFAVLEKIAQQDKRLRVFSFSRNFGYQRSIYTALLKTKGDAAIVFDCDLQDPPELLPQFIEKWQEGYKIVYGVRKRRKESRLLEWTRKIFYRLINLLSPNELPLDAGDFRLIDRRILDILASIDDRQPYLRGIMSELGFKQIGIPYDRRERTKGESKFKLKAMIGLAIDGIVSQSVIPLRFATYTGLVISLLTFFAIVVYLILHFFHDASWPAGFTTLTILLLLSLSINSLFLGIIGEYLARMYNQTRKRPMTIIERTTEE